MSIINKAFYIIKKTLIAINSIKRIYKQGGYTKLEVKQVSGDDLLKGKKILVTGGGSGIGLAIAKRALNRGASVLICGRDKIKLDNVIKEVDDSNLKMLSLDVSDISSHKDSLEQAVQLLGGEIDILVNNAGIIDGADFLQVSEETWDRIYAVNCKGMYFLSQSICSRWINKGCTNGRRILNISSQGGYVAATYPYRLSKWDVVGMTQGLALKLAPLGILVNGLAPGIVATDMQKDLVKDDTNAFLPLNPLQRHASPDEIAELAVFLVSDSCSFIVGQTIVCDGGFILK
ncbi:SDR family NAD(P)-dependent oxidoreductase [Shewanella loihica]|uniref:SDR family NAD(P)-dependent oxidoreductase n=1 Tax=Shewanella loihica TaxID=359303 RepID=UPI000306938D|nr:SDR family oxidoreductase [Shewanella loihica]